LNKQFWLLLWCRKGKGNEYLNTVVTHQKCMPKLVCMPISQSWRLTILTILTFWLSHYQTILLSDCLTIVIFLNFQIPNYSFIQLSDLSSHYNFPTIQPFWLSDVPTIQPFQLRLSTSAGHVRLTTYGKTCGYGNSQVRVTCHHRSTWFWVLVLGAASACHKYSWD